MNKGLSTLTEVLSRGKILTIEDSKLRSNIKIITFADGTQANINQEVFEQLTK